ncbi:hypothetical protein KR222_001796 [Zaprionus bogoriensis]|nr:hypothetical protein KR222_001796 [Zaprionus bogoriensis]
MSQAASVAPPPPPPPGLIPPRTAAVQDNCKAVKMHIPDDECRWALQHPEVQKACFLSRVCQQNPPKMCQYNDIPSILQIGPTCGLTALSMLLNGQPTAAELLADASALKYTLNGEMFSAQYLYEMARKHVDACQLYEGSLNCAKVKEQLIAGSCLLVPYDADVNHEPCLKYGHRAHWALVVGYLIDDQDEFYVLARHGKTRNLAVWSLAALSESNANLKQFAQPKGYPGCSFLLPPGGIDGALGLLGRSILLTVTGHRSITVNPMASQ